MAETWSLRQRGPHHRCLGRDLVHPKAGVARARELDYCGMEHAADHLPPDAVAVGAAGVGVAHRGGVAALMPPPVVARRAARGSAPPAPSLFVLAPVSWNGSSGKR
ncbi:MAG: hypothetical protein IPI67_02495 [Myxococcales bacterium]|nr:hypothetical protein [Myxococcales bacterium]